jgi:large subunit ribosomal protein L13
MKTFYANNENIERKWYVVDLKDKTLGHASVEIANILRGKNKPTYTPGVDTGDFVIVINADKIKLSGNKWNDKKYYFHSKYVGHMKTFTAAELNKRRPELMVRKAVAGMLPKNKLSRKILKKLKVYASETHPHLAQKPEVLELKTK